MVITFGITYSKSADWSFSTYNLRFFRSSLLRFLWAICDLLSRKKLTCVSINDTIISTIAVIVVIHRPNRKYYVTTNTN